MQKYASGPEPSFLTNKCAHLLSSHPAAQDDHGHACPRRCAGTDVEESRVAPRLVGRAKRTDLEKVVRSAEGGSVVESKPPPPVNRREAALGHDIGIAQFNSLRVQSHQHFAANVRLQGRPL